MYRLLILFILIIASCSPTQEKDTYIPLEKRQNEIIKKRQKEIISKPIDTVDNADDWVLIWHDDGNWKVGQDDGTWTDDYCVWEIFYSPTNNRFKLVTEGLRPKDHKGYPEVADILIKLNKAALEGLSWTEIKRKYEL